MSDVAETHFSSEDCLVKQLRFQIGFIIHRHKSSCAEDHKNETALILNNLVLFCNCLSVAIEFSVIPTDQ